MDESKLNPRFLFKNFVVGELNRLAFTIAQETAQQPAKKFNPIFFYGSQGVGKTHLLQAIMHQTQKLHPELSIYYVSAEEFTPELVRSFRNRSTIEFRKKYRNFDVLLIDDIHLIAGKVNTQEEIFHTFNALYDKGKQIVLASDRSPKEIKNLEERLVARFSFGRIVEIKQSYWHNLN